MKGYRVDGMHLARANVIEKTLNLLQAFLPDMSLVVSEIKERIYRY